MRHVFIEKQAEFEAALEKLSKSHYVSLDTESNSMYVYRERLCVLQMASEHVHAVVDALKVDISPLRRILEDRRIEKIFHSAEADIRTLRLHFPFDLHCIFDVMIAAKYLGVQRCGLENLVREYFGIALNKKYQKADWGRRPLTPEMLDYAASDVVYLLKLRDIFHRELEKKGMLGEIADEFVKISAVHPQPFRFDELGFLRFTGVKALSPRSLAVLKELYASRETAAEIRDVPTFKVVSEETLMAVASHPRQALERLASFRGVSHYVVSRHGEWIKAAVKRGLEGPEFHPPRKERDPGARRNHEAAKERMAHLREWRKSAAASRGMLPETVLGNDILEKVALADPKSPEDLRGIKGFGARKFELYAGEMVDFLKCRKGGKPKT